MKSAWLNCALLLMLGWCCLFNIACDKKVSDSGKYPQENSAPVFSGTWQGAIEGQRAHFVGNPQVTLILTQTDSTVSGTITTSDSAFLNVPVYNGLVNENYLEFYAIQNNIYTGAEVKFSAGLSGNTLSGEWNHINAHEGNWSASKTR